MIASTSTAPSLLRCMSGHRHQDGGMANPAWAVSWFRGMVRAIRLGRFKADSLDGFVDAAKRKGVTQKQIQDILVAEQPKRGSSSTRRAEL